jgi:hypothetical protein
VAELRHDWSAEHPLAGSDSGPPALARAEVAIRDGVALHAVVAAIQEHARTDLAQFNAISQGYDRAVESGCRAQEEFALHERLKRAVEIVHTYWITFSQQPLDAVSEECRRLYRRIHPDQTVGFPRFWLDETRRASLHQAAIFQGHTDVPPQAYFSESHLDTLGFCLFLAIAKYSTGGNAVIVLDDVFTSWL